ncbi:MAG: hypothetical protein K0S74_848 [Chlamydiales bacterium]|jgi:hypothetical protein|nr:hypothetical protein [Chlamydiales bacterium]
MKKGNYAMSMEVRNELRRSYSSKELKDKSLKLRKSEIIDDMFNNRGDIDEKHEKKHSTKLRLSKTSQWLLQALKEQVEIFLKNNKGIEKELEQISLPEEELLTGLKHANLQIRRLSVYVNWLKCETSDLEDGGDISEWGEEILEPDYNLAAFKAIQSYGKDQEVLSIFEQHQQDFISALKQRENTLLNYYYEVHSRAYSFN